MQTTDEKKSRSLDPVYYFRMNIKLMYVCGLKCSMTETVGSFIHKIPTFMTNLLGLVCVALEINLIVEAVHCRDTALTAKILCQLISNIQCQTKGFLFAIAVEKAQIILHKMKYLWEKYPPNDKIQESTIKVADQTLTICKCYIMANFSCVVAYAVPLGINLCAQYRNRELNNNTYDLSQVVLLVKYPFEITKMSTFVILGVFEEYLLILSVIYWVSSDTLFAQVTAHTCLQFKILKEDIIKTFNSKTSNDKEILLNFVQRHRELLRICIMIEDIFSPIIFTTVFLSSVNICVNVIGTREVLSCSGISFSIFKGPKSITQKSYFDGGIYATLFMMTMFQISFFCIFAEKISIETSALADTVYNLHWTTKDYKLRFYIHFIIIRAQRPFYCTAYGFFPIGHQRLTSIIRTAFSYYMMLETTGKN